MKESISRIHSVRRVLTNNVLHKSVTSITPTFVVTYLRGKPRGFPVETALHQQGNFISPELFHEEPAGSNTRTHHSARKSRSPHHDPYSCKKPTLTNKLVRLLLSVG